MITITHSQLEKILSFLSITAVGDKEADELYKELVEIERESREYFKIIELNGVEPLGEVEPLGVNNNN